MTNKTRFGQIAKLEKLMWIAMQSNLESMKGKKEESDKKILFFKALRDCFIVNKTRAILCLDFDSYTLTYGDYHYKKVQI